MSYNSKCALDYTLEQGQTIVHTLIWTFDHNFLKYQNLRLCETENVDHIRDIQFRLKFKFGGLKHDLVEVYYLYPEHVVLEEALLILKFINNNNHYDFSGGGKPDKLLISNKNIEVVANKWQNLYSLNKDTLNINNLYYNNASGTFKLKFQFSMLNNKHITTVPKHQMSKDFENLLLDSMYSDVILRSAEGFEFKVHKGILSSRSTVLKTYFEDDAIQNETLNSDIVESYLDTEVLKEVLIYIYTDKTPRVHEIPDKLLEAAEFYNLPGLKIACEESLHLKLTKDNAIKTLQLADLHSATSLKQLTLEFIKDGHAGVVTRTDDWKSIKSLDLIKTLYEYVTSHP